MASCLLAAAELSVGRDQDKPGSVLVILTRRHLCALGDVCKLVVGVKVNKYNGIFLEVCRYNNGCC